MSSAEAAFTPIASMAPGTAQRLCRACVTIPARNEETSLVRCLDGLAAQVDLQGRPLPHATFEVLLLLNNCTDSSAAVARRWQAAHPTIILHVIECVLPPEDAHVGTARRMLMDTAWWRLREHVCLPVAILSTDADTVAAPDWIARNLLALGKGADVVGGIVSLQESDRVCLSADVRRCYEQDRRYAELVSQLEDALDPQPGDRCPRHLDHFGSSLACTPEAYAAAGGMPQLRVLEDEAFIDRARRANFVVRHDPEVRVSTSGRLDGRTAVGMAAQLRLWQELPGEAAHRVPAAGFLEHRFRMLRRLRGVFATKQVGDLPLPTAWWQDTFREALQTETTCPGFLGAVYCDILIAESFAGAREESIADAIADLRARLRRLQARAQARRVRTRWPTQVREEGVATLSGSLQ